MRWLAAELLRSVWPLTMRVCGMSVLVEGVGREADVSVGKERQSASRWARL